MAESVTIADLNLRLRSEGAGAAKGIDMLTKAFQGLSKAGLGDIQKQLGDISKSFTTIIKQSNEAAKAAAKVQPAVATPAQTQTPKTQIPNTQVGNQTEKEAQAQERSAKAKENNVSASQRLSTVYRQLITVGGRVASTLRNIASTALVAARYMVAFFQSGNNGQSLLRTLQLIRVNIYNIWYLGRFVQRIFVSIFESATSFQKTINTFNSAFGDIEGNATSASQATAEFYQNIADVTGLDPQGLYDSAAALRLIADNMGVASDAADTLSQGFTQLAYDYASFYGEDVATVASKFQSALAGNTRALSVYGITLNTATLQEELYREGINASVNELSRSEKAILTYNTVMNQSAKVQQNFAKTAQQPATQMAILKGQVSQVAQSFSQLFIPAIQAVLPYLIALANAINGIIGRIAQFFGITLPDIGGMAASGVDGLDDIDDGLSNVEGSANNAGKAVKKLRDYLMGFDELNVFRPQEDTASGGSGGGGAGGVGGTGIKPVDPYDFLGGVDVLNEILKNLGDGVAKIAEAWSGVERAAANAFSAIRDSYRAIVEEGVVQRFKDTFIDAIVAVLGVLEGFFDGFAMAWREADRGTAILRTIFNAASSVLDVVILIADSLASWFTGDTGQYWLGAVLDGVQKIFAAIETVAEGFKDIWKKGGQQTFEQSILPALFSVITLLETLYEKTILIIGGFINWGLASGFFDTLARVLQKVTGFLTAIVTEIERWFNGPDGAPFRANLQKIADAMERFVDALSQWWDNGGSQLVELLLTNIAGFVGSFLEFVAALVEWGALTVILTIANAIVEMFTFLIENEPLLIAVAVAIGLVVAAIAAFQIINAILPLLSSLGLVAAPAAATGITTVGSAATASIVGLLGLAAVILAVAAAIASLLFGIAAIIDAIANVINAFTTLTEVIVDKVIPNWDDFKRVVEEGVDLLANSLLSLSGPILEFFTAFALGVLEVAGAMGVMALATAALGVAGVVAAPGLIVVSTAALAIATAMDIASKAIERVDAVLTKSGGFVDKYGGKISDVFASIKRVVTTVGETVSSAIKGVINGVLRFVNSLIRGINNVIRVVRRIPGVGNLVPSSDFQQIPYLARGGSVGSGGLFVAGEAGPELVGSFGGNNNTVMPLENSGFVEAMASAVFSAVTSAMSTSGGSDDSRELAVYLDATKVSDALYKNDQLRGVVR